MFVPRVFRHVVSAALAVSVALSAPSQRPQVALHRNQSNIPAPYMSVGLLWPPKPPYSHTVKELGAAGTLLECQERCIAYRNADVSPVSGWTRCESFTWLSESPSGGRCVGVVDASEWHPVGLIGAVAGKLTWPPAPCHSDADCSYNGVCSSELCQCDPAWKGDRCQTLALLPTPRNAGLRLVDDGRNTSTWGGSVLQDDNTGVFHMWASEMLSHCGIDSWTTNSHVIHATSTDGVTWSRKEEVWPSFSHEPNVVRAPTGEWVMYWTALDPGQARPPVCTQCSDGTTPADAQCVHAAGGSGPTFMSWSRTPEGPWAKPQMLFESQRSETNMDTNLAVVLLRNGSVVGIGRTGGGPTGIVTHLVTASDWKDPATYVGRWRSMLFPNTTLLPNAGVEDPHVYVDRRGVYHAVFHNQIEADDERLCGGHAYSEDGIGWVFTGTAWSNTVHFVDGTSYSFSRRERPHIVSARDPFKITGLTTGVQFGTESPVSVPGQDACYTLYQPTAV